MYLSIYTCKYDLLRYCVYNLESMELLPFAGEKIICTCMCFVRTCHASLVGTALYVQCVSPTLLIIPSQKQWDFLQIGYTPKMMVWKRH